MSSSHRVGGHTLYIKQGKPPIELLSAAVSAALNAYAPYSHFPVGAAVLTSTGGIYTSANMENSSYGLSICAEVGAIQAALAAGQFMQITHIAVAAKDQLITPCGRCRQIIFEASQLSNVDIEVWSCTSDPEQLACHTISELLPHAFKL